MSELVAGVDSSTQSTKVVVVDAADGRVVRTGQAAHPDTTEVHPSEWWRALRSAGDGLLDDVRAVAVAGQQHGMVTVDGDGEVVREALLWNDVRSASAADDLVSELGGGQAWADAVGSVPLMSFTVTKLRWFAEHEPELAKRAERVLLPHDWLTWQLLGGSGVPTTDRGDASGTGYYSAVEGRYRTDLLVTAFGRELELPTVLGPAEVAGHSDDGVLVAAGTGDNMAAGLALELADGDVAVSLGTSGTVFGVSEKPTADGTGVVAGFADATGRFLPLACTLNAARVLTSTAAMLGTDLEGLDALALSAEPGAGGLTLLPYLDGERTPNLPDASGSLVGLRRSNMTPANVARAAVEGMLCGLAAGLDALRDHGVPVRRVLLTGGASRSAAVRAIAPGVFGVPVLVPPEMEHVAVGAARQAAWALSGAAEPPSWRRPDDGIHLAATSDELEAGAVVNDAHRAARRHLHP
ncbi:xylulokinase [Prauserella rugosa]|uniref:Xylulose kinase n=1 Tax=Prauserella rugosa TaxID=43354 RepID=A0A660CIB1_9PSEU|nr:xylulokinase [Prauserella rugosa]KMS88451.1 xylulose kinase [Streptomyces regensis]TWH21373.1 xylulokinase [Prauserella rugosa]